MIPEADYFNTHEVAGKTVTRTLSLSMPKFGYLEGGKAPRQFKEITVPVFDSSGEYVVRFLQKELEIPPIEKREKPIHTLVLIGGGASEAKGNAGLAGRIEDAIKDNHDQLPFSIKRIVVASHITGSPRTRPKKGEKGVVQQANLQLGAEILQKAFADPEVKLSSAGMVLVGFSEGGTQAVELAGLLKEKCPWLILADPAGMAEHPNLFWDFSIGTLKEAINKYKIKGEDFITAFQSALKEIRAGWATPEGMPSLTGLLKDALDPGDCKGF